MKIEIFEFGLKKVISESYLYLNFVEAYEMYESEDGEEVVTPLPEMHNVSWIEDLGFDDLDALDQIEEREFDRIRSSLDGPISS